MKELIEAVITIILFFVFSYTFAEIACERSIILASIILGAFILAGASVVAKWIVNIADNLIK